MKCYKCKAKIESAVRVMLSAKDKREKDGFRNLCEGCYTGHMAETGYVFDGKVWRKDRMPEGEAR